MLGILKNPSYAGVYVFGRYLSRREIPPAGDVSWQDFEQHQQRLAHSRTNAEPMLLSGAAREGLALRQGLLLCGRCGRRVTIRYRGNGGIYPTYECNPRRRDGVSPTSCLSMRCALVDTTVSRRVLDVHRPAELELAAEAPHQLEHRDQRLRPRRSPAILRCTHSSDLGGSA